VANANGNFPSAMYSNGKGSPGDKEPMTMGRTCVIGFDGKQQLEGETNLYWIDSLGLFNGLHEDLELAASMELTARLIGCDAYSESMEWSSVLPNGVSTRVRSGVGIKREIAPATKKTHPSFIPQCLSDCLVSKGMTPSISGFLSLS
jgi:hypothetical protein